MELIKSACAVASINFKRWITDSRVRFVFLFSGILVCFYLGAYTSYGFSSGTKCTIWILPLLFESGMISPGLPKMLFHLGMLILLCDAPFLTRITPYMVLRSRRTAWCLGECGYIVMAAFVYTVFLSLMSMLIILPVAEFSNDWGSAVRDLMYGTDGMSRTDIIESNHFEWVMSSFLYRYVYPVQGHLYTFAAAWGSFSFLGLLMYMVSLMSKKLLPGMCVSGVLIFIDPILAWVKEAGGWADIFSPVSWTSLDRMSSPVSHKVMTIPMALGLYVMLCMVVILITWRVSRRTMIEVRARK